MEIIKFRSKPRLSHNALYISYDGLLEPLGKSQIIPYLKGLSKKGIECIVLTFEKKNDLLKHDDIIRLEKELNSFGIIWKKLKYHKNPTVLSTVFDIIYGCLISLLLIKKNRIKIVHARSYVASLMAIILQKTCQIQIIFDMRGFWADERVEAGIWKKGSYLYHISKYFEKVFLLNADEIVSLTHAGKAEIMNFPYSKNPMANITIIPTSVDLERFKLERENNIKILTEMGRKGKFIFIYTGSISTWYMPEEMIDFFGIAKGNISEAHFLVLTREKDLFEGVLKAKNFNNGIVSVLSTTYESVSNYLLIGKAGIAFYKPGYSRKGCCPTKFGEYLACGLPVIINTGIGDCDEIVLKEKVGVVINGFSSKEYERAIRELNDLLSEGDVLRKRCRTVAEKYFSLEMGVERYWDIYKRLGGKG